MVKLINWLMKRYLFFATLICVLTNTSIDAFSQNKYLLVVDVQNNFYENTAIEKEAGKMIDSINLIIAKTDSQHVIYIKATGKILTVLKKGIKIKPVIPELDSNLVIVNNNIYTKTEGDAFSIQKLNKFLVEHDAKEIIITGLLAEKCIYKTAIGGKNKGYVIYVVPGAIVSRSEVKKKKVLKKMIRRDIKILPVGEILNLHI